MPLPGCPGVRSRTQLDGAMTERQKGFAALGITVLCWVGSSELMQWMQEGEGYTTIPSAVLPFPPFPPSHPSPGVLSWWSLLTP